MYLTNNATALYMDGEMQYHTIPITDGGLNCAFTSPLSKGPLNDGQQATLIEGASHLWQDTSGTGTYGTHTSHAKASPQVTSCISTFTAVLLRFVLLTLPSKWLLIYMTYE